MLRAGHLAAIEATPTDAAAAVDQQIASVVEAGKSEPVFLKEPLPVVLVYWTVSVGASGDVRFARDLYGRDAAVLRARGAAPVPSVSR